MDPERVQSARDGIDRAGDHVRGENMRRIWVRVAEEVGECYGWEGVVVSEGRLVELDHYGYDRRCICRCCTSTRTRGRMAFAD